MIARDLLAVLRCPMDPRQALVEMGDQLRCQKCELRFRIQDGFPVLVVEEAELPPGCDSVDRLPCQLAKAPPHG